MRRTIMMAILPGLLAFSAVGAQDAGQDEGRGNWVLHDEIDPLYQTPSVFLTLDAESGTSTDGKPIYLVLRCMGGKTAAFINWYNYLGGEALLTTRLGNRRVESYHWGIGNDHQGAFYPGNVNLFIARLMTARTFVAEATPLGKSPITAVFFLEGLENAIVPLEAACPA